MRAPWVYLKQFPQKPNISAKLLTMQTVPKVVSKYIMVVKEWVEWNKKKLMAKLMAMRKTPTHNQLMPRLKRR